MTHADTLVSLIILIVSQPVSFTSALPCLGSVCHFSPKPLQGPLIPGLSHVLQLELTE